MRSLRPWILSGAFLLPFAAPADERQETIRKVFSESKDAVVLVSYRVHAGDDPASPVQEQRVVGVVLDAKGLILVSGLPFPEEIPSSRYDHFRVALPGEKIPVAATFLGRGKIPQVAFLRISASEKLAKIPFLTFQETELQLADEVLLICPTLDKDRQIFYPAVCNQILEGAIHGWKTSTNADIGCPVLSLSPDGGKAVGVISSSNPADPRQSFVLSAKDFLPSVAEPPAPASHHRGADATHPRFRPGWFGLRFQTLDSRDLAEDFGLPSTSGGVIVTAVMEDSPATAAGLRIGDVVLAIGGTEIKQAPGQQMAQALGNLLGQVGVGQEVPLTVWRDGQRQEIILKAAATPLPAAQAPRHAYPAFGFVAREMVWEDRYAMRLSKDEKGVVCGDVGGSTWAADAGLRPNDVIRRVDDEDIADLAAFQKAFEGIVERKAEQVFLTVLRGGRDTLTLKLEPHW